MGCKSSKTASNYAQVKQQALVYLPPDPDLGWRNISAGSCYPVAGWDVTFQNERSGNVLQHLSLKKIAINIAIRAGALADRYGVVPQRMSLSSSNLADMFDKGYGTQSTSNNALNKAFGVPHYKWKLDARNVSSSELSRENVDLFVEDAEPRVVAPQLQLMRDGTGRTLLLDAAEIAINFAEQLFRLEKHDTNVFHRVPEDTFNWRFLEDAETGKKETEQDFRVALANEEGEAFFFVPEELIMNVASWVQDTYLTTPIF